MTSSPSSSTSTTSTVQPPAARDVTRGCVVPDCDEKCGTSTKTRKAMLRCEKHAQEHRERCRKSYKRRISRNQAIGQQKMTIEEMKSSMTDERIANRRLRKRLDEIQKEHDTFVKTITSTTTPGTPKGDNVVFAILSKLHGSVNQLIMAHEAEEACKAQLKEMTNNYDKLLERSLEMNRKLGQMEGKLLSQKQLLDLLKTR